MTRLPLLIALTLLAPAAALAQSPGAERHELRQDRQERRDDRRDLARLEALLARLDAARGRNFRREIAAVDDAVLRELATERAETRHEAARDRRELRHDADPRERRDDWRDLQLERRIAQRRDAIAREFREVRGRFGPPAVERRRDLLVELVGLARGELREDRREAREDHRELEDHRAFREGAR